MMPFNAAKNGDRFMISLLKSLMVQRIENGSSVPTQSLHPLKPSFKDAHN
jgi:hypothetical protein